MQHVNDLVEGRECKILKFVSEANSGDVVTNEEQDNEVQRDFELLFDRLSEWKIQFIAATIK